MNKSAFFILLFILAALGSHAQNDRAAVLAANEQSIGLSTGVDYSILPIGLEYRRGANFFNHKYPITLGANVTIPLFAFDLSDVRVKLISETTILRNGNFELRAGIDPVLVNTKMQTETMTSLGTDLHLFTGLSSSKWNVGVDITYNHIFTTHIKHTDKYKENVFTGAVDGWYKNTASNLKAGITVGRRFHKMYTSLSGGISKTGTFNSYLFVPTLYGQWSLNYVF